MTKIEYNHTNLSLSSLSSSNPHPESGSWGLKFLNAVPVEGIAFIVASLAARIFIPPITAPLLGIGISVIITRVAIKAIEWYDTTLLVGLTKEACKFNKNYPKLQMITFICALALSFISKTLSFLAGVALGSFGSVILDVESYKSLQQTNRIK